MLELIAILFVLGVIACTIIGFFTLLKWLFGSHRPTKPVTELNLPSAPTRQTLRCTGCGATFKGLDAFCMQCGTRRAATPHSAETDLVAAQRALLRLFNLKQLDESLYQSLTQKLGAEQTRLRGEQIAQPTERQRDNETTRQREFVAPPVSEPISPAQPFKTAPASPSHRLPAPPSPPEPRRTLPEMLAAFMEESSIRWGELVGGLLIIGCSLALVISLWSEIAERPFLKFSVFMSMTAALFGLGFYSAHRWKLPTTSRGVLLTSTLLVPLNFLAVTALGRASSGLLIVLAEIVAWFVFAALVWRGAQVYAAEQSRWIAAITMGVSLALLAAKHLAAPTLNWANWLLLGALPVTCFVISVAGSLRQTRANQAIESTHIYSLFAVTGTGLFATLLPLGLLLARGELSRRTWQELVPLLALLGVPLMAVGWLGWRRIQGKELAAERTIATSIGLAGAALLAGSTLLAFPFIDAMLFVALLNAAVFGWAASRYDLRAARWLSFAQGLYASLLVLHLLWGNVQLGLSDAATLLHALFSYVSGIWLFFVSLALLFAAEFLRARKVRQVQNLPQQTRIDAELAAALCALPSFALITYHAFGLPHDPLHAVWLYALYALTAFALAWRHTTRAFTWLGFGMLLMTSAQTFAFALQPSQQWSQPWTITSLAVALFIIALAVASLFNQRAQLVFTQPALQAAALCVLATAPFLLFDAPNYSASYLLPAFVVAATWALYGGYAAHPVAAMGGGLLFNYAASFAVWWWLQSLLVASESLYAARLLQINLAVSALYAFVWYGLTRRTSPAWDSPHHRWVLLQSRVVTVLWLALMFAVAVRLIASPWRVVSQFAQLNGGGWAWALAALVAVTYALVQRSRFPNHLRSLSLRLCGLLALGAQTAALVHRWETGGAWLAYFTLTGFVMIALAVALAHVAFTLRRHEPSEAKRATLWTNALSGVAIFLALRGLDAPAGPWRSVVVLSLVAVAMFVMQGLRHSRAYAYAAAALSCVALTVWIWGYATGGGSPMDLFLLNGIALTLIGVISLLIELRNGLPTKPVVPAFHQFIAFALLAASSWWLAAKLWHDFTGTSDNWIAARGLYSLLFFASLATLLIASWWDAAHRWRFAAIYWFGLLIATAVIDRRNLFGAQLLFCFSVVGTLYAVGASLFWRSRAVLSAGLQAARIPGVATNPQDGLWWLTPANSWLAGISTALALFLSSVMEPSNARVLTALVSLLAPLSLYLLVAKSAFVVPPSGGEPDATNGNRLKAELRTRQLSMRWLTLALIFTAILGCAWQGVSAQFTHQLVIFTALSLLVSGAFFLSEARPLSSWTPWLVRLGAWEAPLRQVVNTLGLLGLTALISTLALEWGQRLDFGAVQLATWATTLVAVLFFALLLSLLAFALWPGRDPLSWESTARSCYVYGAEIFAVLLFIHVRLVAPWLFTGRFQAWWPIIILLLAFVGVTLSELLRRRGRTVLADPLERTGIFLPLLPALAYGLAPSNVDYAGVLLGVALFYGLWAVMRHSFGFSLLAILAGNGGWWHWLQRTGDFGFFAHPQVWLIPAGLSVLLAAHLNRNRLSLEQLTTIRYVALMTIYISSTADIFLNGVADSPWLPLALAVLSVAGVMMGIMLRIRAYLFLGTSFLLLAVITLVWHAAVSFGWRWLWYVAGIAFGMAIIYLFAMFERHRTAWLLWMERFKSWQA